MQDDIHRSRKLAPALIAGLIAIVVNTAMLEAARLDPARHRPRRPPKAIEDLLRLTSGRPWRRRFMGGFASSRRRHACLQDGVSHRRRAAHGGIPRFAGQGPRLRAPRLLTNAFIVLPGSGKALPGAAI